jgi:membrane protease YdiL (CAAX protease family)
VNGLDSLPGDLPPTPEVPFIPPKPRFWSIHLLLIAAYPIVVGLSGVARPGEHQPALSNGVKGLLYVCAVEVLVFGIVFGLAWMASRATRDDLLLRWRNGFWTVPLGVGYSIALRIVVPLTMLIIAGFLMLAHVVSADALKHYASANAPDIGSLVDVTALKQNPAYFWLTVTLASFLLGGLREELWRSAFLAGLRKLWPRVFDGRKGQLGAAALGAIIFGLGHMTQGPLGVCLTGLLGFGLGIIMIVHRSIWPAVIAHGLFDATSFALLSLLADKLPQLN